MNNYEQSYQFDFRKRIYPQSKLKKTINKMWVFIPLLYISHFLYLENYLLNNKTETKVNIKPKLFSSEDVIENEYGLGRD